MQPSRSFRPISARGTDGEIAFEPTALFPDPMLMCPDIFGARVDYNCLSIRASCVFDCPEPPAEPHSVFAENTLSVYYSTNLKIKL